MARRLAGGRPTRDCDKDPLAGWAIAVYAKLLRLKTLSRKTGLSVGRLLKMDMLEVAALMEVNEALIKWNNGR